MLSLQQYQATVSAFNLTAGYLAGGHQRVPFFLIIENFSDFYIPKKGFLSDFCCHIY